MINPSSTALIVVDVQNDFCHPEGALATLGKNVAPFDNTVSQIKKCVDFCHETGIKVVYIRTEHGPLTDSKVWHSRAVNAVRICATDWGREFYKLEPTEDDFIVIKHRYSAFIGTNLDLALKSNGISTILLSGFTSNVCVESTARDGFMMNYETITLSDCSNAFEPHEHESAMFNLGNYFGQVMTLDELTKNVK